MSSITHPADLPAPAPFPAEDKAIVFDDVAISFEENEVLKSISFALTRGETKVLLGIAGSGKSTILKLALGLLRPDRGRIWVLGQEVTAMTEQDLFALRSRVGMVFQESALFDSLTVRENVGYRLMEDHSLSAGEVEQRVAEALRFVELEHTLTCFRPNSPAACGAAWPSRAPSSRGRRSFSTTRPPAGSIPSRQPPSSSSS